MSTTGPKISVVMANRNGGRYIGGAIASLLKQTIDSWELIIIDDASDDDSVAAAERGARRDSRIRILVQPFHRGPGAARNLGITAARGEWLAVFDSDDLMAPERLEALLRRTRTDCAEVVADNLSVLSAEDGRRHNFLPATFAGAPRWVSLAEFIDSNRLNARVPDLGYLKPMVSMHLLRETRIEYDERLRIGEDYDFLARILAKGPRRFRLEPTPLYVYRRHAASTSYRIRNAEISALLEAHERFCRESPGLMKNELEALERRLRSLESMLLYDRVIAALKSGHYRRAAEISMKSPQIWPLLTQPVRVRLQRLALPRRNASHTPAPI